eukprot:6462165-Amphidinium_carterae.2
MLHIFLDFHDMTCYKLTTVATEWSQHAGPATGINFGLFFSLAYVSRSALAFPAMRWWFLFHVQGALALADELCLNHVRLNFTGHFSAHEFSVYKNTISGKLQIAIWFGFGMTILLQPSTDPGPTGFRIRKKCSKQVQELVKTQEFLELD